MTSPSETRLSRLRRWLRLGVLRSPGLRPLVAQHGRLLIRIAWFLIAIFGIIACTWLLIFLISHIPPPVRSGTVLEKRDTPAHSERYQSGTVCYSYNKEGSCTYSQPVYSQRYVAESWELRLQDCTASPKPDGTIECRTGWVSVDEQTYDNTNLNTYFGEK